MKSLSNLYSAIMIRSVSFTRSLVGLLIPLRLLVWFIWFGLFLILTHNAYSSSQNLLPCPNVIKKEKNLDPPPFFSLPLEPLAQLTPSTRWTSSAPPTSSKSPESTTPLAPLARRDEAQKRSPQEPEIFKQLPEPPLRALKELARMQIAADETLATGNTTLYSEGKGNALRPVAAPQGPSLFQEAIGNRLKAHHLEIKTRELKGELAKQGFHLNNEQWMNLLQYQIYLIQNQEMATSELRIQANKAAERDEKERAYQQQELSLLQLAVRLIQEAQNLDQESNDHTYQNSYRLGEGFFMTSEWIDHPHRLLALIDLGDQCVRLFLARYVFPQDHWKTHPQWVTNLIKRAGNAQSTLRFITQHVMSKEYWAHHSESPSWLNTLFQLAGNDPIILRFITQHVMSKEYWAHHSESHLGSIHSSNWPETIQSYSNS